MDNFLTDRDYREEEGIDSLGKQAIHFELFMQSLQAIMQGKKITIPGTILSMPPQATI